MNLMAANAHVQEVLGQVFPRYTDSVRWILGPPGWCGCFTVSGCYHSKS